MNFAKGWMLGLIAGTVGAIAWAVTIVYANMEIGYLAWGIGGLVGFCVAYGHRGGGASAGAMAVLIAVLSICAGKYVGSYWQVERAFGADFGGVDFADGPMTDEQQISLLADQFFADAAEEGKYVDFEPADSDNIEDAYPAEIWASAKEAWTAMPPAEREAQAAANRESVQAFAASFKSQMAWRAFMDSFGMIDVIFLVLGIATAWRLASADGINETAAPAV